MDLAHFTIGRSSGVLMHLTSLPGRACGDLGPAAYRFVDWLALAGQAWWQVLPLVDTGGGASPYSGICSRAANPLLLSMEALVEEGLLDKAALLGVAFGCEAVDFSAAASWKEGLLRQGHQKLMQGGGEGLLDSLGEYRAANSEWVEDYALFRALRDRSGGQEWTQWPVPLRDRDAVALAAARLDLACEISFYVFVQWLFDRQWLKLREYAASKGVRMIGDVPIFVGHDSVDVWRYRELFDLDGSGAPQNVAGVPPDYFSAVGQRWGNPLFRWDAMSEDGYAWWVSRLGRVLGQVDLVRLDHFRGFESYWEIPAAEPTAIVGRWRKGPGASLFHRLTEALGPLPLFAEDLGDITPEVNELRRELGLPGMAVLQFGFEGDADNPHAPANHVEHAVVYTGTHDNDTTRGWWNALDGSVQGRVMQECEMDGHCDPVEGLLRAALASPARLCVVPVQDVLGLGSEARLNVPGVAEEQWQWRLDASLLTPCSARRLREMTESAGRVGLARLSQVG
jgi:4-alpha-glucanotransferase